MVDVLSHLNKISKRIQPTSTMVTGNKLSTLLLLLTWFTNAFVTHRHGSSNTRAASSFLKQSKNDDEEEEHPLYSTSRLSHVMLKVPSVDRTVAYWIERMGTVTRSSENDDLSLKSAFVALGNGTSTENCFQLELIQSETAQIGNCISYIGVSMLQQFQNNLMGAAAGETPQAQGPEPNGIPTKSCASAPGDYYCRFALRSKDLVETHAFYATILGMDSKAMDENMVCLRYGNTGGGGGIPTTLVFDKTDDDDEIDVGTCMDHLAIVTSLEVAQIYERIQQTTTDVPVFMKPVEMFGQQVMGVRDPNGYKVVIAGA